MKKTVIYFLVLITVCLLGLTLVPYTLSQTSSVKVANYSYYVDSNGFLVVVGQVQNIGANTVDPVVLTGTVTTQDGVPVNSYTRAWVLDLVPQQKAPFYMDFYPPQGSSFWDPSNVAGIDLNVVEANATSSYQYPDLVITSSQGSVGTSGNFTGAYGVNGIIKNTGSQSAYNLSVVAVFFNSTGAVVGAGYTEYLTPPTLDPSATMSFQIYAFDLNQSIVPSSLKISSYELLVQAQGPILQGTAPVPTPYTGSGGGSPNTTPTATPSGGQVSNPTSSTGSSSQPTSLYAAVVVITVVAVAAALLLLRRRGKSEPEQEAEEDSKPVKPAANTKSNQPAKTKKKPTKTSGRPTQ